MFTGLIETVGTIKALHTRGNYRILHVASALGDDDLTPGESVSCDGVCLTVVLADRGVFSVEVSQETAKRTTLNRFTVGSRVNLERALKVGGRLGGHLVSGHIDETGVIDYMRPVGQSQELAVRFSPHFDRLVIDKGSIAINGVSLTVNACGAGRLSVNLIPFTVKETTLGLLKKGDRVNLEFDMVGKYLLKMQGNSVGCDFTTEKLIESGW